MKVSIIFLVLCIFFISCEGENNKPNIILIMVDDMGYECLSCNGSLSYNTPILDSLATNGIRFSHCISQPVCTPSRVKIMTGMYNYRNYEYWGYLNQNQYTFGNLMQEAGYKTCICGKWQLNGLHDKERTPYADNTTPYKFGFDEYCLWQLTRRTNEGERYSNPLIEQNGMFLETDEDDYGPDIFTNYIIDFINRNKENKFFIYYPMVLVHAPFVPTPDSESWEDQGRRYEKDTCYFKDMVLYVDKIVGRIVGKLKDLDLDDNTIILFTGDNGTDISICTNTINGRINGGKGNTTDAGTLVPLIVYWPEMIKKGFIFNELIEFSDFFPTLADIIEQDVVSDGKSFYSLLKNNHYEPRKYAFVHYDPFPFPYYDHTSRLRLQSKSFQNRGRFVRNINYKLYQDGRFFDLRKDNLENDPLHQDSLTNREKEVFVNLKKELSKHSIPIWNK